MMYFALFSDFTGVHIITFSTAKDKRYLLYTSCVQYRPLQILPNTSTTPIPGKHLFMGLSCRILASYIGAMWSGYL